MADLNKLNKIASTDTKWQAEAKQRRENRNWQKHSQKIAIKILRALREQKIKQNQLAAMIGVSPQQISKIVKGNENLTLQSIAKIEEALNIQLIFPETQRTIYQTKIVFHNWIKIPFQYTKPSFSLSKFGNQSRDYLITRKAYDKQKTKFEILN